MLWVSAMLAVPGDSPVAGGFIRFWQETAVLWLLGAALAATLTGWRGPRDPAVMNATAAVLDQLRRTLFGDGGGGDDTDHRVTLFKHVWLQPAVRSANGWCWPGTGWLVPVARSGHLTKNTRTRFRCPDDPTHAEGVAGRAWAQHLVFVTALRDLNEASDDASIGAYAGATNLPAARVRKRVWTGRREARSLAGFRVDDTRDVPWGVIVVDSRFPTIDEDAAAATFEAYGKILANLAESI